MRTERTILGVTYVLVIVAIYRDDDNNLQYHTLHSAAVRDYALGLY